MKPLHIPLLLIVLNLLPITLYAEDTHNDSIITRLQTYIANNTSRLNDNMRRYEKATDQTTRDTIAQQNRNLGRIIAEHKLIIELYQRNLIGTTQPNDTIPIRDLRSLARRALSASPACKSIANQLLQMGALRRDPFSINMLGVMDYAQGNYARAQVFFNLAMIDHIIYYPAVYNFIATGIKRNITDKEVKAKMRKHLETLRGMYDFMAFDIRAISAKEFVDTHYTDPAYFNIMEQQIK